MEQEKRKIELYKTRTFSQKISDTFEFVTENWKPLLKFSTYLLLPLAMLMAVCMTNMMDGYSVMITDSGSMSDDRLISTLVSYGGVLILGIIFGIVCASLIYACMRLYAEREQRLQGLTGSELKPRLLHGMKRMGILTAIGFVLAVILIAAVVFLSITVGKLSGVAIVLVMALLIIATPVVLVPFSLTAPIYLFEDETSAFAAIGKAWRLGFATWGGTFAVLFILGMLAYMAGGALSLPYVIVTMTKILANANELASMQSNTNVLTSMLQYLLAVFTYFTSYLLMSVVYIGLAYQYGHASDKIDGTGTNREIEQFDTL